MHGIDALGDFLFELLMLVHPFKELGDSGNLVGFVFDVVVELVELFEYGEIPFPAEEVLLVLFDAKDFVDLVDVGHCLLLDEVHLNPFRY